MDAKAALDRMARSRVVLIGSATRGSDEFHRERAALTRALITRDGFGAVAVEAGWADAEQSPLRLRARRRPAPSGRWPTSAVPGLDVRATRWSRSSSPGCAGTTTPGATERRTSGYEHLLHRRGLRRQVLEPTGLPGDRLERGIGGVYREGEEPAVNYFGARIGEQFDVLIHIDEPTR